MALCQKPMQGTDTNLNPYLAFNGSCRKAMTFYKEALDGKRGIFSEIGLDSKS